MIQSMAALSIIVLIATTMIPLSSLITVESNKLRAATLIVQAQESVLEDARIELRTSKMLYPNEEQLISREVLIGTQRVQVSIDVISTPMPKNHVLYRLECLGVNAGGIKETTVVFVYV